MIRFPNVHRGARGTESGSFPSRLFRARASTRAGVAVENQTLSAPGISGKNHRVLGENQAALAAACGIPIRSARFSVDRGRFSSREVPRRRGKSRDFQLIGDDLAATGFHVKEENSVE